MVILVGFLGFGFLVLDCGWVCGDLMRGLVNMVVRFGFADLGMFVCCADGCE